MQLQTLMDRVAYDQELEARMTSLRLPLLAAVGTETGDASDPLGGAAALNEDDDDEQLDEAELQRMEQRMEEATVSMAARARAAGMVLDGPGLDADNEVLEPDERRAAELAMRAHGGLPVIVHGQGDDLSPETFRSLRQMQEEEELVWQRCVAGVWAWLRDRGQRNAPADQAALADGLGDLVLHIRCQPRASQPQVVLTMRCDWGPEQGLGVLLVDGQVEQVGTAGLVDLLEDEHEIDEVEAALETALEDIARLRDDLPQSDPGGLGVDDMGELMAAVPLAGLEIALWAWRACLACLEPDCLERLDDLLIELDESCRALGDGHRVADAGCRLREHLLAEGLPLSAVAAAAPEGERLSGDAAEFIREQVLLSALECLQNTVLMAQNGEHLLAARYAFLTAAPGLLALQGEPDPATPEGRLGQAVLAAAEQARAHQVVGPWWCALSS